MTAPVGQDPRVAALAAYDQQQAMLREQMIAALVAIWGSSFAALGSPAGVADFIKRVLPLTGGAQRAMATLTNAYLNQAIGRPVTPINFDLVTGVALRNGEVKPSTLYSRPVVSMRTALAQGKTLGEAEAIGRKRLIDISGSDLQLAKTHTSREVLTDAVQNPRRGPSQGVVGFRRVLSDRGNHCAMCILASTQRYHSFDLMPMHPGCQCSVAPIIGETDPGQVLDEEAVKRVHEVIARDLGRKYVAPSGRAGSTRAGELDYRDIVIVNNHGELGPVLGVRGQNFTGPDLIPRLTHDSIESQRASGRLPAPPEAPEPPPAQP